MSTLKMNASTGKTETKVVVIKFQSQAETDDAQARFDIRELEAQVTPRRLREAALNSVIDANGTTGKDWLQVIDNQLAAKRGKLIG